MPKRQINLALWQRLAAEASYRAEDFSQLLGWNLRTLQRHCLRHLGCTPSQWLDAIRMQRARKLARAGYKTRLIARLLRYPGPAGLCRDFKLFHGLTVGQCRGERPKRLHAPDPSPEFYE